jgi:hypothetical protein
VSGFEKLTALWVEAFEAQPGIRLERGLSDLEVDAAEAAYQLRFPPDLRACLQTALPLAPDTGPEKRALVPNWRDLTDPAIVIRLSWPWEGIVFDLEHGSHGGWVDAWGPRAESLAGRIRAARREYQKAPRLVPIYGHRYIPGSPRRAGNPVFSVYQLDIIHYGADLGTYLRTEFMQAPWGDWPKPRRIKFWSNVVDHNNTL